MSSTTQPTRAGVHAAQREAQRNVQDSFCRRDLLGLAELSAGEIRSLLHEARSIEQNTARVRSKLLGRCVATLFFEDSTRTRSSFALAARRLGADVVDCSGPGTSVAKGETILDTARTIEAMVVDALVVRSGSSGAASMIADELGCAVLNAGDGLHEHPTQGLLDLYTFAEAFDRLESLDLSGLELLIVGDAAHSRVARSAIAGFTKLGARVVCAGPPALAPASMESLGAAEVDHDLDRRIGDADAVMTLRIQFERGSAIASRREYAALFRLDRRRRSLMKNGAIVMHPGPLNRGVEIESAVADGPGSVILRQVRNGVLVRMAALEMCIGAPR